MLSIKDEKNILYFEISWELFVYYCLQWNNIETSLKYSNNYNITSQRIANVR